MKKVYVLAAAALICVSANATNSEKRSEIKAPAKVQVEKQKAQMLDVVATEGIHRASKAPRKKAQPVLGEAFYKRPAGSMFGALTSEGYLLYNPYVTVKAYANTTFEATPLDVYNWKVQLFDGNTNARQWYTGNTQKITVTYGYETDTVPSITDGVTEFHLGGTNSNGTAGWSTITAVPNLQEWTYSESSGYVMFSPKFFGKRDGAQYATTRYSGAKDAEGGTSGMWFGHNYSGWNAMGLYVEKPENPYVLTSACISYNSLDLAADADIKVEVYKVASRVADDEEGGMDIIPGELIASGIYTFVKDESPEEQGVIEIPFVEELDELTFEVTPTIDDEIFVVVSGYDSENFNNFSMAISADQWDEGYGQHGYMVHNEGGEYTRVIGLDHFFTSSLGYVAPTVFLNIVNPFMVYNYNAEEGVRTFDKEGNCTSTFKPTGFEANQLSIYSYTSSEEMTFTLEDGSDLPEWINIEAEDIMEDGEFSNLVTLTISCDANAGAPRDAKVMIAIPGAYISLDLQQEGDAAPAITGDINGDGTVDMADVNLVINSILGKGDGNYNCDVNGDGTVDMADVNIIINTILGK